MGVIIYRLWKFSDGTERIMSSCEAMEYATKNNVEITHNADEFARATRKSVHDGFKPGWHPGLKCYIRGYEHFKQEMKRQNMDISIAPMKESDFEQKIPLLTEENAREIRNATGANVSDRELDTLCRGEHISAQAASEDASKTMPIE